MRDDGTTITEAVVEDRTGILIQISKNGIGLAFIVMDGLEIDELIANLSAMRRQLRTDST